MIQQEFVILIIIIIIKAIKFSLNEFSKVSARAYFRVVLATFVILEILSVVLEI